MNERDKWSVLLIFIMAIALVSLWVKLQPESLLINSKEDFVETATDPNIKPYIEAYIDVRQNIGSTEDQKRELELLSKGDAEGKIPFDYFGNKWLQKLKDAVKDRPFKP